MGDDCLHRQLIKLGDMMGDGLHHEPDGKWIEKEYARVFNALYPDVRKQRRAKKAIAINENMLKLFKTFKCSCGGELKQSRSGSKVAYCVKCNLRYKAGKKKSV